MSFCPLCSLPPPSPADDPLRTTGADAADRSIRFGGQICVFAPPPETAAVNDEVTIKPDEESP